MIGGAGMTSPRRSATGAGGDRFGVFLFPLSLPQQKNRPGLLCRADSFAWVAPAKRVACRFDALQNSRSNQLRAEKSFRLRRSFRRAPVLRVPTSFTLLDRARPVFSFSSGRKFGAPAATQRSGCGGERRKEWSRAQSSPSGGDGAGGISSDDMGGALHQPCLLYTSDAADD